MRKILSKRYRDSAAVNLLADLAIRICFKTLFFLKVETALIKKKRFCWELLPSFVLTLTNFVFTYNKFTAAKNSPTLT